MRVLEDHDRMSGSVTVCGLSNIRSQLTIIASRNPAISLSLHPSPLIANARLTTISKVI